MLKTVRFLNNEEKCELINALAIAKTNNSKKAKQFRSAAEAAHHAEDVADLNATAERNEMWAQLDEAIITAIRDGNVVFAVDECDDECEEGEA